MTAADYDEIRHLRALLFKAYAEIKRLREALRGRETIQVGDAEIEVEAGREEEGKP